jgi:hypothetical protein
MNNVAVKLSSKINTISAADIAPGTYYWTVKCLYPADISTEEQVSGPGRFTLQKVQFSLSKPLPIDPGIITTAAPFTLYWKVCRELRDTRLKSLLNLNLKKISERGDR